MSLIFVTGSNSAFFNSLLVFLQSFSERLPGQRLFVCDYGLTGPQATFLRGLGLLLEWPPSLAPASDVFVCKAALLRYLRHGGHRVEDGDAVVWMDGDLTVMDAGVGDFDTVVAEMRRTGAVAAACGETSGRRIDQMIAHFPDASVMRPFARVMADSSIESTLPYFSTGLFFCRSAAFLAGWDELTSAVDQHPLFEQNMFNVELHRRRLPFLGLDCETWQAQGSSLDKVALRPCGTGRPQAVIGSKNIRTLHATSPAQGHLLIAQGRLTAHHLDLTGLFKLFFSEPLRLHQLELLASFVLRHGDTLLRLGICGRAARPSRGFEFNSP